MSPACRAGGGGARCWGDRPGGLGRGVRPGRRPGALGSRSLTLAVGARRACFELAGDAGLRLLVAPVTDRKGQAEGAHGPKTLHLGCVPPAPLTTVTAVLTVCRTSPSGASGSRRHTLFSRNPTPRSAAEAAGRGQAHRKFRDASGARVSSKGAWTCRPRGAEDEALFGNTRR